MSPEVAVLPGERSAARIGGGSSRRAMSALCAYNMTSAAMFSLREVRSKVRRVYVRYQDVLSRRRLRGNGRARGKTSTSRVIQTPR